MSRIFLVRHGEVEGNSSERPTFSGWKDVVLTPRGELQARAVAGRLQGEKVRAVYASDLVRARRTAEAIAGAHGLKVQTDANLREVNYGAWSGLGEPEIVAGWNDLWQQRKADPINIAAPDGESVNEMWRRVHTAWQEIVARHANEKCDEDIVIVGHNGSIRALVCHLLGVPLQNYRRVRISNCGVTCVRLLSTQEMAQPPLLEFINQTCHLDGI